MVHDTSNYQCLLSSVPQWNCFPRSHLTGKLILFCFILIYFSNFVISIFSSAITISFLLGNIWRLRFFLCGHSLTAMFSAELTASTPRSFSFAFSFSASLDLYFSLPHSLTHLPTHSLTLYLSLILSRSTRSSHPSLSMPLNLSLSYSHSLFIYFI